MRICVPGNTKDDEHTVQVCLQIHLMKTRTVHPKRKHVLLHYRRARKVAFIDSLFHEGWSALQDLLWRCKKNGKQFRCDLPSAYPMFFISYSTAPTTVSGKATSQSISSLVPFALDFYLPMIAPILIAPAKPTRRGPPMSAASETSSAMIPIW